MTFLNKFHKTRLLYIPNKKLLLLLLPRSVMDVGTTAQDRHNRRFHIRYKISREAGIAQSV
jgi:hypothetical protein